MPDLPEVSAGWRVVEVGGQELLQATLPPGADRRDPALRDLLGRWPGPRWIRSGPEGVEVLLTRRVRPRTRERPALHLALLLLTLVTTTLAGGMLADGDPLRLRWASAAGLAIPVPGDLSAAALAPGLWFSLPLMAILGAHELGHWALARRHGMDVSPPYFVPAPYLVNLIGTFGAFIRLRSPLLTRGSLLDVGAAGPLAGVLLAVPLTLAGLALSTPHPGDPGSPGFRVGLVLDGTPELLLGESAVFALLRWASPVADAPFVALHPMAFAGWLGFFFTALNLFPVSQLDGGHVVYALSRRAHGFAGAATLALLLLLGTWSPVWLFWGVVVLLLGRGRLRHPPVLDPRFGLGPRRRAVAWACLALFALTLVPVPFGW